MLRTSVRHFGLHRPLQNEIKKLPNSIESLIQPAREILETQEDASIPTFNRLKEAYQLFSSSKSFRYACNKTLDINLRRNTNLLEDLMRYPKINGDLIQFLVTHYAKLNSVRTMLLNDLFRLLQAGHFEYYYDFMSKMSRTNTIDVIAYREMNIVRQGEAPRGQEFTRLACSLIMQAVHSGEPLVAALFAMQLHQLNISIDAPSLRLMVSSLSVSNPTKIAYHSFTILKLLESFPNLVLPANDMFKAVRFMLADPSVPYHANMLYDRIANLKEHNGFVDVSHELIRANLEAGNVHRALDMWRKIDEKENVVLARQMLERLAEEDPDKTIEFIENDLPSDLHKHPALIDFLLALYGQNPAHLGRFENLTRQLKPPLLHSTLSLLFASFLSQNKENGAERILQTIFLTKNGLTHQDFAAIISKFLRQQNVEQSVEMCSKTDIEVAKFGYVRLMEYFLTHSSAADVAPETFQKKKEEFFTTLVQRFQRISRNDDVLRELTKALFRYLSHHRSNGASRKLFIKFAYPGAYSVANFHFESFSLPTQLNRLVVIDKSNRLSCLSIIFRQATKENDIFTVKWCVEEMRTLGLSTSDIIRNYLPQSMLNKSLRI